MIRNIQFEHIHDKNINNGYTVDDVYSFASSLWCDNMETTDADNSKIISEDYSDAFKILCEAKEAAERKLYKQYLFSLGMNEMFKDNPYMNKNIEKDKELEDEYTR